MSSPDPGTRSSSPEGVQADRPPHEERIERAGKQAAAAAEDASLSALDDGKRAGAAKVRDTSQALDETASSLSAQGQESLAQAAAAMSKRLSHLAGRLEGSSLDDLTREAQALARDNPAMFMAGGAALGFALSRFFKASSARSHAASQPGAPANEGMAEGRVRAGRSADPASSDMSSGNPRERRYE